MAKLNDTIDFFLDSEFDLQKLSDLFASCGLLEFLVLDLFECENGLLGATVTTVSGFFPVNDGWDGEFGPSTPDEIAAVELFMEKLKQECPEIRYC